MIEFESRPSNLLFFWKGAASGGSLDLLFLRCVQ